MTAMERALRERIRAEGPITVEAYMAACNTHYYATRDPLGAAGDFTTAPEVSQMFGELVGACLADCWRRAGAPRDVAYVELGPGRGTLAVDALRVMDNAGLRPEINFVETSPTLRDAQSERHPIADWHESLLTITPGLPLMIVANEFFDALPIRQWVDDEERSVALNGDHFQFSLDGAIREDSPARNAYAWEIAAQLDVRGGVALIVDYGHHKSAPGDTLQAVKGHRFVDPLANPGEQDLTAHVDFEALIQSASVIPAKFAGPAEQGHWLRSLGIEARAEALANAHPERASQIAGEVARLCDDDQMGKLFKVMAIYARDWPEPAGFAA